MFLHSFLAVCYSFISQKIYIDGLELGMGDMFNFTYKDIGHCTILVGTLEKNIAFHWIVHSLLYVLGC
jgi:hypothetical protein